MSARAWWDGGGHRQLAGHDIFVRTGGAPDGPWTTFLHGFPTSSLDWEPTVRRIDPSRRWLALDFLGFGASEKPAGHPYSLRQQADIVQAAWAAFGVERTRLVAHDYGVSVAQELLAREAPLEDVVLLNGGVIPALHRPLPIQKLLAGRFGPLAARLATERAFRSGLRTVMSHPPSTAELHEHWLAYERDGGALRAPELLGYIAERRENDARWVGALTTTSVSLKFVWGPDDPVSGAHALAGIRELLGDPDVVELEGVGHYPQLEAPDAVARALA